MWLLEAIIEFFIEELGSFLAVIGCFLLIVMLLFLGFCFEGGLYMSFMEIMFLIPFIMLAIALYAAFDAIATISFDDYEEIEEED